MPTYSAPPYPKIVYPSESFVHFDGSETPSAGLRSVPFARGASQSGSDNGSSWYARAMPVGSQIQVCGANVNQDNCYVVLATLTPDVNGNACFTDIGRAAFYSVVLSVWSSGRMPIVECQR